MLEGGYWQGLKKYYEEEYKPLVPSETAVKYAKELIDGDATILDYDRPFDPWELKIWISNTESMAEEEAEAEDEYMDIGETEMVETFPGLFSYENYAYEIAAYFLQKDIARFKKEIENENMAFVNEAIRLNWTEMLDTVPGLSNILFMHHQG